MTRTGNILCVVDPLGPGTGAASLSTCKSALRALEEKAGIGSVTVGVLGSIEAGELARECGLSPSWRVPIPCDNLRLARRTLTRLCDRHPPSVCLAWGHRAAKLLSHGLNDSPLVVVLDAACAAKDVRRAELAEVLCIGEGLANRACDSGWLPIRIRPVTAPMPQWQQIPSQDRNSLRRKWQATDKDLVVGVLPLSDNLGDSLFAFNAMGRVALAGHGAHLVLHPSMHHASRVRLIARNLGLNDKVHFESSLRCPWTISPAVDVWLSLWNTSQMDETALHPCCSAALGAPVVVTANSFAASAIEHRVEGSIADGCVNAFAFEMIQLAANATLRQEMVSACRLKFATQNVQSSFVRAVQESVERVCPEALLPHARDSHRMAETKFAAAST